VSTPASGAGLNSSVGAARPRLDAAAKVTGRARFGGDLDVPGLLHGRPVLAPYAHARIEKIETAAAMLIPGVQAVLTAADLPLQGEGGRANEPLARSEIVFAGQPVALVVAETEAAAEDGVEAVVVDYQPLEAVVDVERALTLDSALARTGRTGDETDVAMHGDVRADGDSAAEAEPLSANVTDRYRFEHGDVEASFAACAQVVAGRFRSSWIHQGYLETQVAVAWPEGEGGLAVYSSTQGTFFTRQHLSRVLGIPIEKVRVEAATLGGGFGGKLGLIEPLVAGAALSLERPVRVALTRSEDFAAANPAPALTIDLEIGAQADGRLAALRARILVDTGAFSDSSPAMLAGPKVGGPYRWDEWDVRVYAVRTNRFGAGAYRAPTAPQTAFALESLVDEVAGRLGLDPIELRIRSAATAGDLRLDGSPWPPVGTRQVLEAAQEHRLWRQRQELPGNEAVGLAAGLYPGAKMGAAAVCRMDADGGLSIVTGYVDMTGTATAMAAIAAETFGIPSDRVRIVTCDTSSAPQSGVSGGSMVTYCLGSAVQVAAEDARRQLLQIASEELEVSPDDLEIADGAVRPVGVPARAIPLAEIGAMVTGFGSPYAPVEGHGTALPPELAPSAAVAIVRVRVAPDTGHVQMLDYVALQDVGRAINPALCEGQMRGGAAQSIGYALYEELLHDDEGQLMTGFFTNYAVPTIEAVPSVETIILEVPSPHGPFGARGIGESAVVPGAAAIANAVAAATGVRFREIPMTPERVWTALQ
jgi:CO/xanthine dehydrogenase Mo-binding subunit